MKPYNQLTKQGKVRRLRKVALKALEHYDFTVKRLSLLVVETNTHFRVETTTGEKYVLRIYSEEETTLLDNLAEIYWLNALKQDTNLHVTEPVARQDGEFITTITVPNVPPERRCVLFKWIPGKCLAQDLTAGNYETLGQLMARLHNHSESLDRPLSIQPKRWDKVFYYKDEPIVFRSESYQHLFPKDRIGLLETVIRKANNVFEELYADERNMMLIHGDLHFWNVHIHRNRLYLIDFEDTMLGYPVQDIAITLSYGRTLEGYRELRDAFERGYTSLRPWPVKSEAQFEALIAARSVMFVNYVAHIDYDEDKEKYIKNRCQELEQFLEIYGVARG